MLDIFLDIEVSSQDPNHDVNATPSRGWNNWKPGNCGGKHELVDIMVAHASLHLFRNHHH